MLKKVSLLVLVLAICLVVFAQRTTYVQRGSIGAGTLYWNTNEALLFISEANEGARMSYARYELEPLFVGLGRVRQPSNKRCSRTLVIRVTIHDVHTFETNLYQYAAEPYCGFHFDLFQGQIYAVSWPRLWKWTGAQFEPAAPAELRAFDARNIASRNSQQPSTFDNIDGWSMRELGQTPAEQNIDLDGQPVTVAFHGASWPPQPLSVELIRPGQPAQTVWSLTEEPRRVSRIEYERLFGKG